MHYILYHRPDFLNFLRGSTLAGTIKFTWFCAGRLSESLPQIIRPFRRKLNSRQIGSRTFGLVTWLTYQCLHTLQFLFIIAATDHQTSIVKWAYALCAGPPINPAPHFATVTLFDLCNKQSWINHVIFRVEMPDVSYTLEQRMFMYDTSVKCRVWWVRRRFRHKWQDVTFPIGGENLF
jgi:hypothetical protein